MSGYTTKRQHNGDKWACRQEGLPGADLALYVSWISCTSWPWPASDLYCRLQLGLSGMRWSVRERMKHSYVCYIKTHTDSQLQSVGFTLGWVFWGLFPRLSKDMSCLSKYICQQSGVPQLFFHYPLPVSCFSPLPPQSGHILCVLHSEVWLTESSLRCDWVAFTLIWAAFTVVWAAFMVLLLYRYEFVVFCFAWSLLLPCPSIDTVFITLSSAAPRSVCVCVRFISCASPVA